MNKTLGENIARLRKEKGMTQEELAREYFEKRKAGSTES